MITSILVALLWALLIAWGIGVVFMYIVHVICFVNNGGFKGWVDSLNDDPEMADEARLSYGRGVWYLIMFTVFWPVSIWVASS